MKRLLPLALVLSFISCTDQKTKSEKSFGLQGETINKSARGAQEDGQSPPPAPLIAAQEQVLACSVFDSNDDGAINSGDLLAMISAMGSEVEPGSKLDGNHDGIISTPDYLDFLSYYGEDCLVAPQLSILEQDLDSVFKKSQLYKKDAILSNGEFIRIGCEQQNEIRQMAHFCLTKHAQDGSIISVYIKDGKNEDTIYTSRYTVVYDLLVNEQDQILIAGGTTYNLFEENAASGNSVATEMGDIFFAKLDSAMNPIWGVQLGQETLGAAADKRDDVWDMELDSQGNIIAVGATYSSMANLNAGYQDALIVRVSQADGALLQMKQFGSESSGAPEVGMTNETLTQLYKVPNSDDFIATGITCGNLFEENESSTNAVYLNSPLAPCHSVRLEPILIKFSSDLAVSYHDQISKVQTGGVDNNFIRDIEFTGSNSMILGLEGTQAAGDLDIQGLSIKFVNIVHYSMDTINDGAVGWQTTLLPTSLTVDQSNQHYFSTYSKLLSDSVSNSIVVCTGGANLHEDTAEVAGSTVSDFVLEKIDLSTGEVLESLQLGAETYSPERTQAKDLCQDIWRRDDGRVQIVGLSEGPIFSQGDQAAQGFTVIAPYETLFDELRLAQ